MAAVTSNNNCPREDCIFKTKVKDILLLDQGNGGIMGALLDFRGRHEAAKANGQEGLSYNEFLSFLEDNGVELTEFEQHYLCRAFDDDQNGFISDRTFVRHLIGVNKRRLAAIEQVWNGIEKDADGGVSQEALVTMHESVAGANGYGAFSGFASTFSGNKRRSTFSSSAAGAEAETAAAAPKEEGEKVGEDEFRAFYAALSQSFASDEAFERFVLHEWDADIRTKPKLNDTQRDWGEEGDPLAVTGPRYVGDALKQELGISSKQYNYTHMAREWPPVEPLPPLNRSEMMTTTHKQFFPARTKKDITMADPLATRRQQEM